MVLAVQSDYPGAGRGGGRGGGGIKKQMRWLDRIGGESNRIPSAAEAEVAVAGIGGAEMKKRRGAKWSRRMKAKWKWCGCPTDKILMLTLQ